MSEKITSVKGFLIYNDIPIDNAKHFNFDAYSNAISKIILNKENKTPFTIAINGKWGSGKTTLMRTLRKTLDHPDKESSGENNRKVKTVWFNAWKYSETDSMLAALVLEILEEMRRKEKEKGFLKKLKAEKAGGIKIKKLKMLTDIAKILSLGLAPDFDKWLKDPEYKEKLSFYDLFRKYMKDILLTFVLDGENGEYNDEKGILVIFIDDLDRCLPKNITKLLESINLFFDQEGCFFVIGTDISLTSNAINYEYKDLEGFSGRDYIKKMIQLQFNLPAIEEEGIKKFIDELGINKNFKEYFYMITKGLESNQREIKRFLNYLNFMKLLSESINLDHKEELFKEELLIKWSVLNYSSEDFIKTVNDYPELIIKMQEISILSKNKKKEVIEYIKKLDEPYKNYAIVSKKMKKLLRFWEKVKILMQRASLTIFPSVKLLLKNLEFHKNFQDQKIY